MGYWSLYERWRKGKNARDKAIGSFFAFIIGWAFLPLVLIGIYGMAKRAASYVGWSEEPYLGLLVTIGFVWTYTSFVIAEKHKDKIEHLEQYLDRLTDYAKEIDPRFDDERRLLAEFNETFGKGEMTFAGMNHMELVKEKRARGQRTLLDPI